MKIKMLRNIGTKDLKKLGVRRDDLMERNVVDVDSSLGQKLIAMNVAEQTSDELDDTLHDARLPKPQFTA